MRQIRLIALGLVLVLGLAACQGGDGGTEVSGDTEEPAGGDAAESVEGSEISIAQAVPTLGYLTIDAARALDTFGDVGLELDWAQISGGDPTLLAAVDAGDIQFGAPGSPSVLQAISQGEDYQIIYSLMSMMSIELTVSNQFMEQTGVSPDDPIEDRLAALDGVTIGVSGLGGAQDRIARWLGDHAGLGSDAVNTVNIGPPPALRAAVETGQIDGYVLTAPNGQIAEEQGFGQRFIRLGEELPGLDEYHHTVLVIKSQFGEENPELVTKTVSALADAADQVINNPDEVAARIQEQNFEEVDVEVIQEAVNTLAPGLENGGRMTAESLDFTVQFANDTGYPLEEDLDAASGEGDWWTNEYIDRAAEDDGA